MSQVARILSSIDQGDPTAAEELLPLVYNELRRLAAYKMGHEPPGQTLQATALVHEAWMDLTGNEESHWNSRNHFFKAAAEAMRRILIHNARRKQRLKHGGNMDREELHESQIAVQAPSDELLAVHEALDLLEREDPQAAHLVKLRYFVGMNLRQAAESLDISTRSVDRLWAYARAWLHREIKQKNI